MFCYIISSSEGTVVRVNGYNNQGTLILGFQDSGFQDPNYFCDRQQMNDTMQEESALDPWQCNLIRVMPCQITGNSTVCSLAELRLIRNEHQRSSLLALCEGNQNRADKVMTPRLDTLQQYVGLTLHTLKYAPATGFMPLVLFDTREPVYLHGLTSIPLWITNYIHYKMCSENTYPFSNLNDETV